MKTRTTSAAHPDDHALERGTVIHLAADQSMASLAVDDEIWRRRAEVPEFQDGRVLSVFDYAAPWTYWERHPVGVELVHVLSGSVVFHLEDRRGRRAVDLVAGQSLLVPEGAWHRAHIARPASMLFVTPTPARTEHRPA
jgi:mannose-6-phosphate isomerase-like protein (cupin superfamily)